MSKEEVIEELYLIRKECKDICTYEALGDFLEKWMEEDEE